MKKKYWLLLASIGLWSFTHAYAGSRPGALTITLAAGEEIFPSKRQIESADLGLLAVGYDFTSHWGIEGMFGRFTTNFKKSAEDNREISGDLFAVDAAYHFVRDDRLFEPFVLVGVGFTGLTPNISDPPNEGNINAALGVQFFIHKMIALRAEMRDFYTLVGGKNDVLFDGGVSVLVDFC